MCVEEQVDELTSMRAKYADEAVGVADADWTTSWCLVATGRSKEGETSRIPDVKKQCLRITKMQSRRKPPTTRELYHKSGAETKADRIDE